MLYNPEALWYIISRHFHLLVVIVGMDHSQFHGRIAIIPHHIVDDILPHIPMIPGVYCQHIQFFDGTLRLIFHLD